MTRLAEIKNVRPSPTESGPARTVFVNPFHVVTVESISTEMGGTSIFLNDGQVLETMGAVSIVVNTIQEAMS